MHNTLARHALALLTIALSSALAPSQSAEQKKLPRRDVVDVPAVGEGLCVHNLFQSHMVLQRDKPIRVWGWGEAGQSVRVRFGDQEVTGKVTDERSWSVTLAAQKADRKARALTITSGDAVLRLTDILVGDVWVLGGQSNMEFPLERVENGWLEIVSARYPEIRILTVPAQSGPETRAGFPRLHEWSDWSRRHFRKGDWDVCSPRIARELSAIGYVFARRVHMASGVPIGVIDTSRGGTTVETWTPDSVLRAVDTPEVKALLADWDKRCADWDAKEDLAERVRRHEQRVANREKRGEPIPGDWKTPSDLRPGPLFDQNRPGNCYRNMIAPLRGLAVKGAIFHQGYNNALRGASGARMYHQLFAPMIGAWRAAFGDPAMPFGIIALCTDGTPQTRANFCESMVDNGVYIREAQHRSFLELRAGGDAQVGFASSYDKRRSWYHPQLKVPVGERIARWALATQYGLSKRIRWTPPMCTGMERDGAALVLHFDRPVSAADPRAAIEGFAIAGEDRRFQPADVSYYVRGKDARGRPQQDRRKLVLRSPHVAAPLHYRYAWARNPMGNLVSADHCDLPFATQRSDDWPVHDVPRGVLAGQEIEGDLTRKQRNQIRRALRAQDEARARREAEALLGK